MAQKRVLSSQPGNVVIFGSFIGVIRAVFRWEGGGEAIAPFTEMGRTPKKIKYVKIMFWPASCLSKIYERGGQKKILYIGRQIDLIILDSQL